MLFNSFSFLLFLPLVFTFYWFLSNKGVTVQNCLLLFASYFFYSFWDWRFLFLLAFSTLLDYFSGIKIHQSLTPNNRKTWLWISVIINLGFLGFFKYYNFFIGSFADALLRLGMQCDPWLLSIILPVGISFYTFHGLSYVIDIYYKRITPEQNFVTYSLFVSFFPLLVAGPIERATHLLPQLKRERKFSYIQGVDGLRQILWGFFKKVVIADNCAEQANYIFDNYNTLAGSTLVLGAVFFAFQIYGDFSGYSDIALGTARLFGIELLRNFAFPYFSRDIAEFWRRWHISLSSWFKDYVYIPLGGSREGKMRSVRNIFVIFILSGFWHGANWTFIVWGFLNALYFLPLLLTKKNRNNLEIVALGKSVPTLKEVINMTTTFALTTFAWIFFRAESMSHAWGYLTSIFSKSFFSLPVYDLLSEGVITFSLILLLLFVEWLGRENRFALESLGFEWPKPVRLMFYSAIIFSIGMFMQTKQTPFIYFQF